MNTTPGICLDIPSTGVLFSIDYVGGTYGHGRGPDGTAVHRGLRFASYLLRCNLWCFPESGTFCSRYRAGR